MIRWSIALLLSFVAGLSCGEDRSGAETDSGSPPVSAAEFFDCVAPWAPCQRDRQCVCPDGARVGWLSCRDGRYAEECWCPEPPPRTDGLPGCVEQPGTRVGWQQCTDTGEKEPTCWCPR